MQCCLAAVSCMLLLMVPSAAGTFARPFLQELCRCACCCCCCCLLYQGHAAFIHMPGRDFKVAVLDVSALVEQQGGPACVTEDEVVADASNGVIYTQEGQHKPGADGWQADVDTHHGFGTHSAPWHLLQASAGR